MKIMSVDFGDTRTGIAVCDRTEFLASPVGTIVEKSINECVKKVAHLAAEYEVGMIIVGYPKNMNGSIGPRAKKCEQFANKLKVVCKLPVELWDERATTLEAAQYLNATDTRGKRRKEVIDTVAATIILESYLKFRENKKQETKSDW